MRAMYQASFGEFLQSAESDVLGQLQPAHTQDITHTQTKAWQYQIELMQRVVSQLPEQGLLCFEFVIPRMGKRADCVLVVAGLVIVIEFKVGADKFVYADRVQASGYAFDLKHFHSGSHDKNIVPILVCSKATHVEMEAEFNAEGVSTLICTNGDCLLQVIQKQISLSAELHFDPELWINSPYKPTPTIVEAAQALYANHNVEAISRSEAGGENIAVTSVRLLEIIHKAKTEQQKVICFVTGVPGAGKTLVGLNIATQHSKKEDEEYSVFLSGNGPLVAVLQEALARDLSSDPLTKCSKQEARQTTQAFIQNIHRFRDESLKNTMPPAEHVAIFDEAQRAWDLAQTAKFMMQKRGFSDFQQSEPEFLMSVMDRHQDWAVIIALIGGGQEINTGEAGLAGWFDAVQRSFPHWRVYCSPNLFQGPYLSGDIASSQLTRFLNEPSLHLATSMRSFRAENLADFIHFLIAGDSLTARSIYQQLHHAFPIRFSRNLLAAKQWVRGKTVANRRCGVLASSNALRLKAEGIFVKNTIEPEHWFLASGDDIRSSNYLEDVATEFDVQGLEVDWALVAWDADLRWVGSCFEHWRFKGSRWERRGKKEQQYLENSYRVLLTRAREGMVIYIPLGAEDDHTRNPDFYQKTADYLKDCGIEEIL